MKLRDLAPWVGISGTTLRRRARNLGYNLSLGDELDVTLANRLYREVPVSKILTIRFTDSRRPEVEFMGPWNMHDWRRLHRKIELEIALRNREFIKAVRRTDNNGNQDSEEESEDQDQSASNVEAVTTDTATEQSPAATSLAGLGPDVDVIVKAKEQNHDDRAEHGECAGPLAGLAIQPAIAGSIRSAE